MAEQMHPQLRKRILMFYFAAGIQIVMAMMVAAAGPGVLSGLVVAIIILVCLVFAYVNFYVAKWLTRKWEAEVRARAAGGGERV